MRTQTTISVKQENKGAKGILDLTSTLGQTLKTFIGIYGKKLPDCDGMTVEDWMDAHGVHRFSKAGKKGNYTPALLMDAWHEGMKQGKQAYVFRNVPAKYVMAVPNDPNGVNYRVFTKEEAEKLDGKPISRYMLTPIAENKWNVASILKGLKQTNHFDKENDKSVESDLKWEAIEHVYIVKLEKDKAGEVVRKVIEVEKTAIIF